VPALLARPALRPALVAAVQVQRLAAESAEA
jgi:hypothetical protein